MLITDSNMTGMHAPPYGDSTPEVQEESRTAPRPALAPNCETKKSMQREKITILAKKLSVMAILRLDEKKLRPTVFGTTGLFMCLAVLFFLPVDIPHKLAFPVFTLSVAGLWLLPWQMTIAMLCSAIGDYMGSCGNFIGQMGFFALAHIWIIVYFIKRYRTKVEPDGKLTGKAKGYMAMVLFCAAALLCIVYIKVLPGAPAGIEKIGASCYAVIICAMLTMGLLQRSSLYALGAVLFVFSDFILAWNRFVEPVPYRDYLVLVTYYLAEWLLFVRSTNYRIKGAVRLMRF